MSPDQSSFYEDLESFDNTPAEAEGWALFDSTGSVSGDVQIQYDTELAVLDSDSAAWVVVWTKAQEGSVYHQRALEIIERHNPEEYARVVWIAAAGNDEVPYDESGKCLLPSAAEILASITSAPAATI